MTATLTANKKPLNHLPQITSAGGLLNYLSRRQLTSSAVSPPPSGATLKLNYSNPSERPDSRVDRMQIALELATTAATATTAAIATTATATAATTATAAKATTATATTATAAIATTATAAATATTLFSGTRFINGQCTAFEFLAIEH